MVWESAAGDPDVFRGWGSSNKEDVSRRLREQYPDSPYLRLAWLNHFDTVLNRLGNDVDPDSGASFWHLGEEGRRQFRREHFGRMVERIMSISNWGAFAPEALARASKLALGAGNRELSDNLKRQLITKHGDTALGKRWAKAGADE